MTANTLFEIFILMDVFFIGLLTAIAFRHADAHYRTPKKPAPKLPVAMPTLGGNERLPDDIKQRMLQDSEVKFQNILNRSADQLQDDLKLTGKQIDKMVNGLATQIVTGELENYRQQLAELHKQAEADMASIKKSVGSHESELKAQIAQELQAEKLQLIKQIDTKLGDAVGSFLLEALGHNIDLGSQSQYLIALLEEHKADFKKEVADEAAPAK